MAVHKKQSQCFNHSFIVWGILDIVENIGRNIVDKGPELIRSTLTTLSIKLVKVLCQWFHYLAAVGEFGSRSKREALSRVSMIMIVSGDC